MNFSFVQMADPQFGMYSSISKLTKDEVADRHKRGLNVNYSEVEVEGFEQETALFTKAIELANEMMPSFVVICGDMVHDRESDEQFGELVRISEKLDDKIPIRWVAGNHDVGETPTSDTLDKYRERFGKDTYSFTIENTRFITLNSAVAFDHSEVVDEWHGLMDFLEGELKASAIGSTKHNIVFMHHPLYLQDPGEDDNLFVIPRQRRLKILDLFGAYNVTALFTGHLHRNNYQMYGSTELISSGSVGYPLGDDPSGVRLVEIDEEHIHHRYVNIGR